MVISDVNSSSYSFFLLVGIFGLLDYSVVTRGSWTSLVPTRARVRPNPSAIVTPRVAAVGCHWSITLRVSTRGESVCVTLRSTIDPILSVIRRCVGRLIPIHIGIGIAH